MTYEDAKKDLERFRQNYIDMGICLGFVEVLDNALEAMEKQIPKKPIVGTQGFLKCADCHSVIRITDRYCPKCGQAIDWSE